MNRTARKTELPSLDTERLRLRPFRLSDASDVQRLAGEREIASNTMLVPHPYEDGLAEAWIETHPTLFHEGEILNLAITLRQTDVLIGAIGLEFDREHRNAELGYWIGKPYWGNGYCTEASRAMVTYGFQEHRLHRIHAKHYLRNPASGRVMQNAGMTREGVLREHILKWGVFEDLAVYGILESEWRDLNWN